MFEHSVKVPRLYKCASKIAKEVSEGKGSIKQLVYESKHRNIKALYALVVYTFQKSNDIERLLKKSKLFTKEPRFDPWLAKILIAELLWGKKRLPSEAKPIKTILAYEQIFKAHLSDFTEDFDDVKHVYKPRYVRINTLKTTINEAVEGFRDEGWVLKPHPDSTNYLGFLDAIANLGPEEFMIDIHIPYLLIFPPKTQFYQHPAYKNGSIILQDKASCLPVHLLNPESGSTVLDMCAAPGMKTSHCAAVMKNEGKIYAVEIGKKRFDTLNKIIESAGATCVETINRDVLTLTGEHLPNVEYVLVDPSCSGSGITDRVEIGQQEMEQQQDRLQKLAGFQIKMLRHALTRFPKVRRVVYSTCSVYPEENEDVVRQVLETCRFFKLVPAGQLLKGKWQNFGASDFGDIGNYCLYAKPDIDLTSGFFVAVLERLEEGESNQFLNNRLLEYGKQSKSRRNKQYENLEEDTVGFEDDSEIKEKNEDDSEIKKEENEDDSEIKKEKNENSSNAENKKKKKKPKHKEESANEFDLAFESVDKKKKKRMKQEEEELTPEEKVDTENIYKRRNKQYENLEEDTVGFEDDNEIKKEKNEDDSEIKKEKNENSSNAENKKKKKKSKHREESVNEFDLASESIDKKKKKRIKQEEEELTPEEKVDTENIYKKKKKKRSKTEDDNNLETINYEENVAIKTKKKKKDKGKSAEEEEESKAVTEEEINNEKKKKKKSKTVT